VTMRDGSERTEEKGAPRLNGRVKSAHPGCRHRSEAT
jgi:hypothetical protein